MTKARRWIAVVVVGVVGIAAACDSDDDDGSSTGTGTGTATGTGTRPEHTGAACDSPADCYPDVLDAGAIVGEILCLDRVRDGYCTHTCQEDEDCCAVEGECKTGIKQVCSPFESLPGKMCFLSCEPEDLLPRDAGLPVDEQEYCQREASPDFICRSSGGGSQNRKICVPGDCGVGAACTEQADCDTGLECVLELFGGYCGMKDCTSNASCPAGSLCVEHTDGSNYCMRTCDVETDCSFCRPYEYWYGCTDQVSFVEAGTTGTVCAPGP